MLVKNFRYAIIIQSYIELHPFTAGRKGTALAKQLAPSDGDVKSEIRAHLNRAAEIDPKDPFTWHLLGKNLIQYKFRVPTQNKHKKLKVIKLTGNYKKGHYYFFHVTFFTLLFTL